MSEHRAAVEWTRTTPGFGLEEYNRAHTVRFKDGSLAVAGDTIPAYYGRGAGADPEELYAAAMAACHMLTFLAVAARRGIVVDAYADAPVAFLERDDTGKTWVTRVVLKPRVVFAGEVAPETLAQLHERAHRGCFLANSVKTEISVEPQTAAAR
jgi:organic hydroperoxide reductase OsmC/OhrA